MANTGFRGIDVRQTSTVLLFRSFRLDELGQEITTGAALLYLYEPQSDGTFKSYDFSSNTFKTTALTTETASMTHQTGNNGTTDTGIWTYALSTLTGFTPGAIYIAKVTHPDAVAECREFQFGSGQGDLLVDSDGKLTLANTQTFSTSGSVGSVDSKTGFSLASSQSFSTTGSVGSVTENVTVGSITDAAAHQVWRHHWDVGSLESASYGFIIKNALDASISSRLASEDYTAPDDAATISTQVAADLLAAHGSGSWATATGFATAASISALQSDVTTILGNVDVAISTRLAASSYTTPPTAAAISTQVASDLQTAHGSGSWTTANISGVATATALASLQSTADGIAAKTANLPADPASETNVNLRLLTSAYTAPPSAASVSTQVMTDMATAHGDGAYDAIADVSALATQSSLNAVKAKTDTIPTDPATETTLATLATATALSTLQSSVTALPAASDVAAAILVTPANKLATDGSGNVTAATVSDKTGYSLSASQSFSTSGSVGSVTGNVGGSVASVTADVGITQTGADKVWGSTTRDLTTFGTLVADTAAAVWAVLTSSLTSVGTIGKFFMDRINDTITSRLASGDYTTPPTESAISTQVAADLLAVHGSGSWETATGFAVAGDAMTLTAGAITSVQSGLATDTNLATVDTVVDAIKLKTDNLPSDPASETNVNLRLLASAYTTPPTAAAVSSQVMTDMTAAHGSGAYNQIADVSSLATQASLNAVKAKTDLIPADPATETTLATLATADDLSSLQSSVDALPAASDVATAILVTPANKLATDSSGNVTASSVSDKTGYSLSSTGVTAVQSGLATSSALATVDTVVDGIATTLGVAGAGLTGIPKTGYKLSADGVNLVLIDGQSMVDAMAIIAASTSGKVSGAGSGTETFLGLDGVTTRMVVSTDDDGNRTAVSY